MFNKILLSLVLLSIQIQAISPYTASQLPSFGNTQHEIEQYVQYLIDNNMSVKDTLNWHFNNREQEITQSIFKQYGIPGNDAIYVENLFQEIRSKDPLYMPYKGVAYHNPNDHQIIKAARELLVGYGMNPNAISIISSQTTPVAEVKAILTPNNIPKHTLELNITYLSRLTADEYIAIIKHEIQHLWYGDVLKVRLFTKILPPYASFSDSSLSTWRKHQELRADIMSAVSSHEDINSMISCHQKSIHNGGDNYSHSHPTYMERIAALQQASHYLEEEQKNFSKDYNEKLYH